MTVAVRYHPLWGAVFLALAAGNVLLYTQSANLMFVALAAMMAVMGALYLVRPLLVVGDGAIQVRSLFGGTRRSFPIDDLGALEVERAAIVIGHGEGARRLKLAAIFVRGSDLDRLAAAIRQARAGR
jgi:hypothetical protein